METENTNAKTDETSLPSSDANGQTSSPEQQVVQEQSEQQGENTSQQVEGTEATTETTEDGANQEQQGTEHQPQAEEAANVVLDKQEDAKLDFHKHPRFQEVIAEKNQWRQQVESSKPLVEQATVINNILAENNIPAQEFSNVLQYLIALRKDPAAARAMLAPTFERLSQFTGDKLPADLEAKVGSGVMTREDAVEMAKYRGQQEYQQWRSQGVQQTATTQQQAIVNNTVQSVVQLKQQIDPDFKPGTKLFQQTELLVKAMPVFQTPQEAQAGVEKAYKDAKAFLAGFAPRTVPVNKVRPPQNRNTANNGGGVIKTSADVIKAIQAGQKPHQMRYS